MHKLSETPHAMQQIDECGAMIGISREWYDQALEKLAILEKAEQEGRILSEGFRYELLPDGTHVIYKPDMAAFSLRNDGQYRQSKEANP